MFPQVVAEIEAQSNGFVHEGFHQNKLTYDNQNIQQSKPLKRIYRKSCDDILTLRHSLRNQDNLHDPQDSEGLVAK